MKWEIHMMGFFQNMHMGGFESLRGDYGMRRKICLRGGRIMVWEGCSIEYLRDLCESNSENVSNSRYTIL